MTAPCGRPEPCPVCKEARENPHPRKVGVYHRSKGWLVDTGVGGTFSWDVDQAGWWDTEHHAITELVECDLIPRPGPTTKLTEEILRTRTPFAIVRLK